MLDIDGNPLNLETLRTHFESFGCTNFTRTSLQAAHDRLQRLPASGANAAFKAGMLAATEALIAAVQEDDETSHSLELLLMRIDVDNEHLNEMAVCLWIKHFREGLQFEENPLALLTTFPEISASPFHMCAALCVLIERGVYANDIVSSGLLQNYAAQYAWKMEDVKKTYRLLDQHTFESQALREEKEELLVIVAYRPIENRDEGSLTQTLHRYVLNGDDKPAQSNVQAVQLQSPMFNWDMDENRLTQLVNMFGPIILAHTLPYLPEGESTLRASIHTLLTGYDHHQMASLYRHINTHVPAENGIREHTLTQLSTFVSDAKTWELLRHTNLSPWILLASKSNLIAQLSTEDLERITQRLHIKPDEIRAACRVAIHEECNVALRDNILRHIAVMKQENPDLPLDAESLETLQSSEAVQAWVLEEAMAYKTTWEQAIQANINPFTHDSHITIFDVGGMQRPHHRALQVMSTTSLDLPMDVHQQNACILLQANTEQVEAILAIMHPATHYPDDEETAEYHANHAKTRVLIEALCLSEDEAWFHLLLDDEKPFHAHLKKAISDTNLPRVIASLPEELSNRLQDSIQRYLRDVIQESDELGTAFQPLNATQCDRLLHALGNLTDFIENADELGDALQYLNATQCDRLLNAYQNNLADIIQTPHAFGRAILPLNTMQYDRLLHALSDVLTNIIQNGKQLGNALSPLNKAQFDKLLNALQNDLTSIIQDGVQFGTALSLLNKRQCDRLLDAFPNNLTDIIRNVDELGKALRYLNTPNSASVLHALSNHLTNIIQDSSQLAAALQHSTERQYDILLNILSSNLTNIITNGYQLGTVLQKLNHVQQGDRLLHALESRLSNIIKNGYQLSVVLWNLTETLHDKLLSALSDNLTNIIQDGFQLGAVLQHLNETQRDSVLNTLLPNIADIIQNGSQLEEVLRPLNTTQCDRLLQTLSINVVSILEDGYQLQKALQGLNEGQSTRLLNAVLPSIAVIIQDGSQLNAALWYLSKTNAALLLNSIKKHLPAILKQVPYDGMYAEMVNKTLLEEQRYDGKLFDDGGGKEEEKTDPTAAQDDTVEHTQQPDARSVVSMTA